MQEEKYFTPAEIAEKFRVTTRTVWEWIRTGQLRAVKVGKYYRISEAALNEFVVG
jgi:excisionase family DNA binding protein